MTYQDPTDLTPLALTAPVFISPDPFSPRFTQASAPHGSTVASLVTEAVNHDALPLDHVHLVRVHINGVELLRGEALDYVVQQGDVVNLVVAPQGGKVGKTIFQVLYTIGAAVIGFYFGPGWASLVIAAGQVVSNLIWKPQKPDSLESKPGGALSDSSNNYRRRGMFPLALGGGRRVAPDVAANAYTQNQGEDVWLHVAFAWHYGRCTLDSLKIGETRLEDYPAEDVQVEHFLEPGPRVSRLYPARVVQENLSDELELGGPFEVHTTADTTDRVEIDFTWPQGLNFSKDNGKILPQETQLLVEWTPAGAQNWQPAPIGQFRNRLNQVLPQGHAYKQARSQDPVRLTVAFDLPGKMQADIRVRAWDPDADEADRATQTVAWSALRSIEDGPPILDENLAVTFLRIKSSSDLNGTLPTVTGVPTPICPVWNGADWNTEAPTSNAAALARWLVTGPAPARPWPADRVDASCATAFELIEERGWHGAFYVQDDMTLEDALLALCRMGRFGLYWNGQALCFVPDWSKPFARQLFNGRNVEGYRYRREFPEPVHAVFVEYQNIEADSRGDELWVYADGYDATNAELFETLRIDFGCKPDRAYREGRVYLARRALQVEIHEWKCGVDSIRSTFGDRVRVSHPTALYGEAEARVTWRLWAGGLVVGVRLDEDVEMEAGVDYALDVRKGNGSMLLGLPVSNQVGRHAEILFPAPLAPEAAPDVGDLVVFGRSGVVTEDLEIIDISPEPGYGATIRAQRYLAEQMEAAETGPIPDLNSTLRPVQKAPRPRIIGTKGDPDGVVVAFEVDPTRQAQVAGFQFRWRLSPTAESQQTDWQVLAPLPSSARTARTPAIREAQGTQADPDTEMRVDVELRTVMTSGDVSEPTRAMNILVTRALTPPANFAASGVKRTAPDGSTYGALYVRADAVDGGAVQDMEVEIREHEPMGAAGPWVPAGAALPSTNPQGDFQNVDPGRTYDVRGRWRTQDNWFSPWAQDDGVQVPAGSRTSYAATTIGGLTPQELLEILNNASDLGAGLTSRLRELARATLENTLSLAQEREYADLLGHLDGQKVTTTVAREQVKTGNHTRIFDLMGVVIGDYQGFAINEMALTFENGEAFGSFRQRMEQKLGENTALITDERTARITQDSTFLRWFGFLGAERPGQSGWVLNESQVYLSQTGGSFASYRQQVSLDIGGAYGAVSSESYARQQGDQFLSGRIDTIQGGSGGADAQITQLQQITTGPNGIGAEWTLAIRVNPGNGVKMVSGIRQFNNGFTSSMVFAAQEIGFANDWAATQYPLSIVGGIVKAVNFEVDRMVARSIKADMIESNSISNTLRMVNPNPVPIPGWNSNGYGVHVEGGMVCGGGYVDVDFFVNVTGAGGSIGHRFIVNIDGQLMDQFGNYDFGGQPHNTHSYSMRLYLDWGWHSFHVLGRQEPGGGTYYSTVGVITVRDNKTERPT